MVTNTGFQLRMLWTSLHSVIQLQLLRGDAGRPSQSGELQQHQPSERQPDGAKLQQQRGAL